MLNFGASKPRVRGGPGPPGPPPGSAAASLRDKSELFIFVLNVIEPLIFNVFFSSVSAMNTHIN